MSEAGAAGAAGKLALVTGGNKGIGFEIVRGLAAKGATVLLGARTEAAGEASADALRSDGRDVRFLRIDVTDPESIAAAARGIGAGWGHLDILVNNAAISPEHGVPPSGSDLDLLRQTYETNVFGLVAVTQKMLSLLRAAEAGRIVNMSTGLASLKLTSGKDAPDSFSRLLAYNSSKTAVNAVTVGFANELLNTPIKVNAANPGLCATGLTGGRGRPPSEGAAVAVGLALLGPDGPTGGLYGDEGQVPW
jgi:NAD(P)-dependent dehydrogenase (short-subunit alcohol dehydrogenase family)